jgi:oleandomycin transport system permease protein
MTTLATLPTLPTVHPQPRRVGPLRTLRHGATLTWRSIIKIRHSPEQILELTMQPIIFVLLFVYLFGGAIAAGDRHAYLQYVIPGSIVQTVIFSTMGTGVGLNSDISKGIFDRFRSMPIARSAPLIGAVVGDVVRYVVSVLVVIGFGMIIGFRVQTDPFRAVAACGLVLLFALAMCWVTALLGLLLSKPQTVQGIGGSLMFPLTFGSNIFVPTGTLPGWLQAWVKVNPVSKLSEAVRGLMLGGPVLSPALYTLVWTVAIAAVFAPLAVRAYRRRLS